MDSDQDYSSCYSLSEASDHGESAPNGRTYPRSRNIDRIAPGTEVDPRTLNIPPVANGQAYLVSRMNVQNSKVPPVLVMDLAEKIKGFYRLLDLISEPAKSGSNGCVDKIIIAHDSLKQFINAICPGTYANVTKVDFKALNRFLIKPLGVYGSKIEIVRLLRSLNAVNEHTAQLLLAPEPDSSQPTLSSGLYALAAGKADRDDERHYIIYWPEDSTWNDSATSSVCQNRVMFIRYLTSMCDQVIALLSAEHSASLVWAEEDSNAGSVVSRPGFQMNLRHIPRYMAPPRCSVDASTFVPRLLLGETVQGFWTVTYVHQYIRCRSLDPSPHTVLSLNHLLNEENLLLSEDLDEDAVQILVDVALSDIFPDQCNDWNVAVMDTRQRFRQELAEKQDKVFRDLERQEASLSRALRDEVVGDVLKLFPSIERDALLSHATADGDSEDQEIAQLTRVYDLRQGYHGFHDIYQYHVQNSKFNAIKGPEFRSLKERLISVCHLLKKHPDLSPGKRTALIQAFLAEDDLRRARQVLPGKSVWSSFSFSKIMGLLSGSKGIDERSLRKELKRITSDISDSDFLLQLNNVDDKDLVAPIQRAVDLACTQLSSSIDTAVMKMAQTVLQMQQEECKGSIQRDIEAEETDVLRGMLLRFIREVNKLSSACEASDVVYIQGVQRLLRKDHSSYEYHVTGHRDELQEPKLKVRVYLMDLTSDDRQIMKFNSNHLPKPAISDQRSDNFYLPLGVRVVFHKLLENERLLLVLADQDKHSIYLERLFEMDGAIQRGKPIKALNRDEVGEDMLFAYDERKRMLTVCTSTRMQLYAFVFDKSFRSLQCQGTPTSLAPFYGEADISILQLSSVCGSDEVVLVDSEAHIRVFSFITQQFRASSLELPLPPRAIYSSPDGSYLLILHSEDQKPVLTAYHLATFGATGGIPLAIPDFPLDGAVLTSMLNRGRAFLLSLDIDTQCVNSVAIDFVGKVAEVLMQDNGNGNGFNNDARTLARTAQHNVLLDCYKEMWEQFPVIPAVKGRTSTSSVERQPRTLTFITENPIQPFTSHFSNLVQGFVKTTKKPTGNELRGIKVSAVDVDSFRTETVLEPNWNSTRYHVGEWLVDLLCLVPIHIAVCRDNQLVPLTNGVNSPELERSLLGAGVNQIVDHLSFGWYESVFKHMATKPVKVVSSMGQPSMGKSFALNHLVNTSFADSAVQTTEGIWLSLTPTDNELIVALDFEGVGSVEKSPQEEALLVLFSAAISNLVLFRNNFATGRDISSLFKPFQSSASIMDPAVNPSLFQSKLVIVIKDVAGSNKDEITREFSLKFQKLVEQDQDINFISRMHGGKFDIISWPVIESRDFYKCFTTLNTHLDQQKASHSTAGEFLYTIKTLMAKLKANDWGSISQTMAEHRSKSLSALLPIALSTGFSEINTDHLPLQNFDTDLIPEGHHNEPIFTISNGEPIPPARIEAQLFNLTDSWTPSLPRQFMPDSELVAELRTHLNVLIDSRANITRFWLDCNLAGFQGEHAAIEDLRRRFDKAVIEMRTNVQVCGAHCASCDLLCIRSRLHEGGHSCNTDHSCVHKCEFCEDELKLCGTRAGHSGKHTCVVAVHLCGEPCELLGRRGCLEDCTKAMGHEDNHTCSALVHMCGEPCDLIGMRLPDETTYFCTERCSIPSNQVHETHSCDDRFCPSTCELCQRRCGEQHLHGLARGMRHLCGEEHKCSALCSYKGICETAPKSIEATFIGKHEKFQYTKYTQVANRLECVKKIPPGQTSHRGRHTHSNERHPLHFCEARCENCGYFCTLPLGHPEKDHETSHGSMTQTRWAVSGPDGTSLEIEGRKFSSNDEGAPMLCNFVCKSMGRHVHIANCRSADGGPCYGTDVEHINERLSPDPDKPKDAITHGLYWRRMGFKDPYTIDEQINFAKCDAMCAGSEHSDAPAGTGQPSYCTLSMFHQPRNRNDAVIDLGYISNDGHLFECNNPEQAFHVIFVVDRSSSMSLKDRRPLANAPMTDRIRRSADNRLGAVYSALYGFWSSHHAAVTGRRQTLGACRDAYSVILFDSEAIPILTNDLTSTPNQLLDTVLVHQTGSGTDFSEALRAGRAAMEQSWSTERTPVMIFLSDGECFEPFDTAIQDLCLSAVQLEKPLSFHSISFGPESSTPSLRGMTNLALAIQNSAPRHLWTPPSVPSSFAAALDSVQLAETFLGIAESLRKPRGSLMC